MTENELRKKVCDKASSWLGRKEADGSHREIVDAYNAIPLPGGYKLSYKDPWCAGFVSAVGAACGLSDIIYPDCGCDSMINKYRAAGRWIENDGYLPSPGDVIFYDWDDNGIGDNTGSSDHVGIVLSSTGSTVSVIEGNSSDMVAIRTRTVDQIYIRGYGIPNYALHATDSPKEDADEKYQTVCAISLPILQRGDKNGYVKSMQTLLIAQKYSCGGWGADGDFGSGTLAGLNNFQRNHGLDVDGICGEKTWAELIHF